MHEVVAGSLELAVHLHALRRGQRAIDLRCLEPLAAPVHPREQRARLRAEAVLGQEGRVQLGDLIAPRALAIQHRLHATKRGAARQERA